MDANDPVTLENIESILENIYSMLELDEAKKNPDNEKSDIENFKYRARLHALNMLNNPYEDDKRVLSEVAPRLLSFCIGYLSGRQSMYPKIMEMLNDLESDNIKEDIYG